MKIGCVKEIKNHEYRVGCTPSSVAAYVHAGHSFYIEKDAGAGSGFSNQEYLDAGAILVDCAEEVWKNIEMMIKVKEPLPSEYQYFHEGLILYTYLHLAANLELTQALCKSKVIGVAYETLEIDHQLPLLKPMSEVAGRLAIQEGAKYLEKPYGGRGVLLSGVTGVHRGKIVIIGGGVVGTNAAKLALGMGAEVVILDKDLRRLEALDFMFNGQLQTLYSTDYEIEKQCSEADLVIGAVLVAGATAPKLVKKSYLKKMKSGAVIVDVAVDQGGCVETTHPTYHDDPTFVVDDVVHYCVANMPGATPRTSTMALTNATLSYGLKLANFGFKEAVLNHDLKTAINTYDGHVTHAGVSDAFNLKHQDVWDLLKK